MDLFHVLHMF